MSREPDYVRKKFNSLLAKNLRNALAHRIHEEFPRLGGERIRRLCAEMILEVVDQHVRPRESLRPGQALWLGIDKDDPPSRHKRTENTRLVPVVLDLSTEEDVLARIDRKPQKERLRLKAVRLCEQAYTQNGLLSNCDLAELLNVHDSTIAQVLTEHERQTQQLVPRRATLHDVGTGLTHKRIICWKRYAEGKSPDQVAQETYHTLEAVDRYLGQFDRVRNCRRLGMAPEKIAHILDCSLGLVEEYLAIDDMLEGKP